MELSIPPLVCSTTPVSSTSMDYSDSSHHLQQKRAMPLQEITRGFSHFGLRASLRKRLGRHNTMIKSRPLMLIKALAVSDGELNVWDPVKRASTQYSNSNSSLPNVPGSGTNGVGQVASWAVSFERLLEDPLGVHYFTEFLKSEVSVENILFWLACETFRKIPANHTDKLSKEASLIYKSYLSKCATCPINIDDKARVDENDIKNPHPDIFQKAQEQIFKLMKFDSYSRFVRSQLYQNCMLANVEGRPLPELGQCCKPQLTSTMEQGKSKERLKVKLSKPAAESEDIVERRKGKMGLEKRKEKRKSWGEPEVFGRPGSFHSAEVVQLAGYSTDACTESKPSADKYCCVFLPDGTASLTPARPGLTIRAMLTSLCEKRGLPLTDIIIYLQGKDKKPLSLDQDSAVLKDQQVLLELRVTFAVEVAFSGLRKAMMVKSNKTLLEALSSMLQKHHLRPQDVIVTEKGSMDPINMDTVVSNLANKTLIMDKVKGLDQNFISKTIPVSSLQTRRGAVDIDMSATTFYRSNPRQKNPVIRRAYDMEGLVDMLNRTQCCSTDDQRGLLRKEDLILPQFLQLPLEEQQEEHSANLLQKSTEEPCSNTPSQEKDSRDCSSSSLCSRKPDDRKQSKTSNPARETVV